MIHRDSIKIAATDHYGTNHIVSPSGLDSEIWDCTVISSKYKSVTIFAEEITNVSLLKSVSTTNIIGTPLDEEASFQSSYPVQESLEPIDFRDYKFLDMNRTILDPFFSVGGFVPWVSIAVAAIGLVTLVCSCFCIVKQRRLLNRMAASALAVNRPLQGRRVGSESSRMHLADTITETSL